MDSQEHNVAKLLSVLTVLVVNRQLPKDSPHP